jgi:hypothetical protein
VQVNVVNWSSIGRTVAQRNIAASRGGSCSAELPKQAAAMPPGWQLVARVPGSHLAQGSGLLSVTAMCWHVRTTGAHAAALLAIGWADGTLAVLDCSPGRTSPEMLWEMQAAGDSIGELRNPCPPLALPSAPSYARRVTRSTPQSAVRYRRVLCRQRTWFHTYGEYCSSARVAGPKSDNVLLHVCRVFEDHHPCGGQLPDV